MVVTKSCVSSGAGCVVVGLKALQDKVDQGAYCAASLTQRLRCTQISKTSDGRNDSAQRTFRSFYSDADIHSAIDHDGI